MQQLTAQELRGNTSQISGLGAPAQLEWKSLGGGAPHIRLKKELGMAAQASNPSTWETEAGGLQV
jgi:hypothetical protein